MKIISFTGKSGTGKSYQANRICMENNIEGIIDDGLFIYKGQVVAGSSAKKCESKAAAMRTALFNLPENCNAVKSALKEYNPEKLMIIGTSDKMVDWIASALGLPPIDERLYIEDFTTEEERETAKYHRLVQGEHVIPAPMGQLKRDFAGYTMNPLKFVLNLVQELTSSSESTIVRPKYSYIGNFKIEPRAIRDITYIVADEYADSLMCLKVMQHGGAGNLSLTLKLQVVQNRESILRLEEFQQRLSSEIESMTSFTTSAVNIIIDEFVPDRYVLQKKRRRTYADFSF